LNSPSPDFLNGALKSEELLLLGLSVSGAEFSLDLFG
jgi:hypothetical protein